LYGGLAGIGWIADRVGRVLAGDEAPPAEDDAVVDIDQAILGVLEDEAWPGPADLVSGLAGLGVFALARLPRADARATLARVVLHLEAAVDRDADGVSWRMRPEQLLPELQPYADRCHSVGVAHGTPGILPLLAAAAAADVERARAVPL